MKSNNSISVIIPLYNKEKYISECLNSVVCQLDSDDELIVVNDGSTDNSLQIVNEYTNKYSNIIVKNTDNNGAAAARNVGLTLSNCNYVLFLDSDDYLSKDTFSIFKSIINKHQPELILGGSKKYFLNGNVETRLLTINEDLYNTNDLLEQISKVSKDPPIPQCYYLYKTELIKKNNYSFFEGHTHEDELWSQQVLLNVDKIYYSKYVFYNYCVRNNSIMTSTNINKSGEDAFEICRKIKELYDTKDKRIIPRILMNRFAELLLMSNYQLDDNDKLIKFTGKMMPIQYSYNKKTIIKSFIYMLSPSLHRKIERHRLG